MDQGPPLRIRYTKTDRRQSREEPQTHRHRGNFPEQILCSKINNQQMEAQNCQASVKAKDTVSKTKRQPTDWE